MQSQWTVRDCSLAVAPVVGASASNTPISIEFPLQASPALLGMVVIITAAGVTLTTGITAKLQTRVSNLSWVDSKTVSIAADGTVYLKLLSEASADQTYFPLLNQARLVISTGTGDAVTISQVQVLGL